jgi:SAM-dependent methyltransferase
MPKPEARTKTNRIATPLNSPGVDRDLLLTRLYPNEESLLLRQLIHELYTVPRLNFQGWVLDRITWKGNERVLDLGAGHGSYFKEIRQRIPNGKLVAGDLSMGMARRALINPQASVVANLDAQSLPFPRRSFDVVLANHFLYHVPNLEAALSEIHRVLKPTGAVIAATNSRYNLPELEQIIRRTYGLLGASNTPIETDVKHEFYLEDAAKLMARHFFAVSRYDLPSAFVFGTAKPAIDYLNSLRPLREARLPKGINWEDFIGVLEDQLSRLVTHFGDLVFSKLTGVLVATDAGGFAGDYVNRLIASRRN